VIVFSIVICKYCNQERGDAFRRHKTANGKDYYRKKCNDCYYGTCRKRNKKLRKELNKIKSTKECEICGFDDWRALQYHHKDSENKTLEIGNAVNRGYSLKNVTKEIEKCRCLCANCHQILHHKERQTY